MKITCNPIKRAKTLAQRGLDFFDAAIVFDGETMTREDTRFAYPERRFQTVGFFEGRMVFVAWTPRDDATHVISMRKCNAKEQKKYRQQFEKG